MIEMNDTSQETLDGAPRPSVRLFSRAAVLWATFLGTPIAGGVLMGFNYARTGEESEVGRTLRCTGLFTACVFGLALVWPETWDLPWAAVAAPQLFLMGWYFSANQKAKVQEHIDRGGRKASIFAATGVGLCSGVALLGVLFGAEELVWLRHGRFHGIPYMDQVYFKDGATRDDAEITAGVLRDQYWFTGFPGTQAQVRRPEEGTNVSLLVIEQAWEDEETTQYFKELGLSLASTKLGPSVVLHLCYEPFESEKAIEVMAEGTEQLEAPVH